MAMATTVVSELMSSSCVAKAGWILESFGYEALLGYRPVRELLEELPRLYGASECYYKTRSRGRGIYFGDREGQVFFCIYPAPDFTVQILGPTLVVLRPELGPQADLAQFSEACRAICRSLGVRIVVKNVSESLARKLSNLGFRPYAEGEVWHPAEPLDEETYPQVVWWMKGPVEVEWEKIQGKLKQLGVELVEGFPGREAVEDLYGRWQEWFLKRHGEVDLRHFESFNEAVLERFEQGHCIWCLRQEGSKQLKAVLLGERPECGQLDVCHLLAEPGRWSRLVLQASALRSATGLGAFILNMGGSETYGLHFFKVRGSVDLVTELYLIRATHLVAW